MSNKIAPVAASNAWTTTYPCTWRCVVLRWDRARSPASDTIVCSASTCASAARDAFHKLCCACCIEPDGQSIEASGLSASLSEDVRCAASDSHQDRNTSVQSTVARTLLVAFNSSYLSRHRGRWPWQQPSRPVNDPIDQCSAPANACYCSSPNRARTGDACS